MGQWYNESRYNEYAIMNNFIRLIMSIGKLIIVATQLVYVWLGFSIRTTHSPDGSIKSKNKAKSKPYKSDRNKYGFPIL